MELEKSNWHAPLTSPLSRRRLARGARAAGRRGESVAAQLFDAPAWTRRWAAEAPVPLVDVRGAATHPYWCAVCRRGGLPASAAAVPAALACRKR